MLQSRSPAPRTPGIRCLGALGGDGGAGGSGGVGGASSAEEEASSRGGGEALASGTQQGGSGGSFGGSGADSEARDLVSGATPGVLTLEQRAHGRERGDTVAVMVDGVWLRCTRGEPAGR